MNILSNYTMVPRVLLAYNHVIWQGQGNGKSKVRLCQFSQVEAVMNQILKAKKLQIPMPNFQFGNPTEAIETVAAEASDLQLSNQHPPKVQAIAPIISELLIDVVSKKLSPNLQGVSEVREELRAILQRTLNDLNKLAFMKEGQVDGISYLLCCFIDEAILSTPWGRDFGWATKSFLTLFHQDMSGGETFFKMVQQYLLHPLLHQCELEVAYLCLTLGFMGRYRVIPDKDIHLESLRQKIFNSLGQEYKMGCAPYSENIVVKNPRIQIYQQKNKILLGLLASMLLVHLTVYLYYNFKLSAMFATIKL